LIATTASDAVITEAALATIACGEHIGPRLRDPLTLSKLSATPSLFLFPASNYFLTLPLQYPI
jgi:hypothetical protein